MEQLSQMSRYDEVVGRLRALVESGEVSAGERLPSERELALRLGVNRSSVREALRTLQTLGLVDIQHGRGVFVREPRAPHEVLLSSLATGEIPWELLPDLIGARVLVEGSLARLAAERVVAERATLPRQEVEREVEQRQAEVDVAADEQTKGTATDPLARLFVLLEQLEAGAGLDPPSLEADSPFHLEVARLAGNTVLEALLAVSYQLGGSFVANYVATRKEATDTVAAHREIAACIHAGDGPGAEAAMRRHIEAGSQNWLRLSGGAPESGSQSRSGSRSGGRSENQGEA